MSIDQADVWEETGYSRESSPKNTPATDQGQRYPLKPSEKTLSVFHGSQADLIKVELIRQTMPGMNGRIHKMRRDIAEELIRNGKARAV